MAQTQQVEIPREVEVGRIAALGVVVVLEALAILSVVLRSALLPVLTPIYPNIVAVAVYLLPSVVGLLSQRLESAILLAVLPFVVLVTVYLAVNATPWYVDLDTLGQLAGRVASPTFLLGGMGALGWLLRQVLMRGILSPSLRAKSK